MKYLTFGFLILLLTFLTSFFTDATAQHITGNGNITLVIHGGAGTILKENMTEEKEKAIRSALEKALSAGYEILHKGGRSDEAVIASIKILEDSPWFNAGKGAVYTAAGSHEMDASIMNGENLNAGAVSGVMTVKNPIEAAFKVMTRSEHVMLSGPGADEFAKSQGLETVSQDYFQTEMRKKQLEKATKKDKKHGTVGAVALDSKGNITAATSTGGMTNKRYGRIGDSPVIGAGTYANNETCGVSCTGHGEFFIRKVVAYDVSAKMKYGQMSLREATENTVNVELKEMGGSGGLIALDKSGNISLVMNTPGMYRGYIKDNGEATILLYRDEEEE
jgi:beta-aspartyl-peptidase (threonine type)